MACVERVNLWRSCCSEVTGQNPGWNVLTRPSQETDAAIHAYWDIFTPNNTCDIEKAAVLLRPKVNSFSCLVKKLKLILNIVAFHVVIQQTKIKFKTHLIKPNLILIKWWDALAI